MKKILCIVFLVLLCFAVSACGSPDVESNQQGTENAPTASSEGNRDYFIWSVVDSTWIEGYTEEGLKQTELVIPAECTKVGGLGDNTTVTSIRFANPDTKIGSGAFNGCAALTRIDLPSNLKELKSYSFANCSALQSITIPDTVLKLEARVFDRCSSLKTIAMGMNVAEIGFGAFSNCTALESIDLPTSLTEIESEVFYGCKALKSVEIGANVKTIGEKAFYECDSLKELRVPEGVEKIGDNAFAFCGALETIYLPSSLQEMQSFSLVQVHPVSVYVVEGSYADGVLSNLVGAEYLVKKYQ